MSTESLDQTRPRESGPDATPLARTVDQLQQEKLEAEVDKLRREAQTTERGFRLELLKTFGSLATVMIAVTSLTMTIATQNRQGKQIEANRRDDRFAALVQQFTTAATKEQRIGSVVSLSPFLADSAYQRASASVLIASIVFERDESVRDAIADALLVVSNSKLITDVARANRQLYRRLNNSRKSRDVLLAGLSRPNMTIIPEEVFQRDSVLSQTLVDLAWYSDLLVGMINRVKEVEGVDLSELNLGVNIIPDAKSVVFSSLPDRIMLTKLPLDSGVVFRNVSFARSNLSGMSFVRVRFENVDVSEALVDGTSFLSCSFDGTTQLDGLIINTFEGVGDNSPGNPVIWRNSVLNVESFGIRFGASSVKAADPEKGIGWTVIPIFALGESSWNIREVTGDFRLPTNGKEQTIGGCMVATTARFPCPEATDRLIAFD